MLVTRSQGAHHDRHMADRTRRARNGGLVEAGKKVHCNELGCRQSRAPTAGILNRLAEKLWRGWHHPVKGAKVNNMMIQIAFSTTKHNAVDGLLYFCAHTALLLLDRMILSVWMEFIANPFHVVSNNLDTKILTGIP